MKVAYVLGGLPFGGVENWLHDLSLEYMKNGLVQGRVFNLSGTGNLLPAYYEAGIDVECVLPGNLRGIATHRLDTTWKLRKGLKSFAPDIIHTLHFTGNHHGRLAALGLGIPVVTHLRNIKHERKLVRRFSDKALSYATAVYLAVSKAVAEVVRTDHNMANRPVRVLYNALNPGRLQVAPLDLKAEFGIDEPVVLAVGRYVPQKNLDLPMRAIALLRKKGVRVSLVLVGEGPERSHLEVLRAELGLERHVILTGFRSDVPAFLRSAFLFAMPSSFEGFPVAHLEAMYCGLPAVVSAAVPSLEIAEDAVLVCACDPADIADKIESLLMAQDVYSRLAARAKAVAEPLCISNYAQTLYGVYQEILGDPNLA